MPGLLVWVQTENYVTKSNDDLLLMCLLFGFIVVKRLAEFPAQVETVGSVEKINQVGRRPLHLSHSAKHTCLKKNYLVIFEKIIQEHFLLF